MAAANHKISSVYCKDSNVIIGLIKIWLNSNSMKTN